MSLGADMFHLYFIMNLLNFFATYVHMHLFAPLTTCLVPKYNQIQEEEKKIKNAKLCYLMIELTTSLTSFIFEVTNISVKNDKYERSLLRACVGPYFIFILRQLK